MIREVICMWLLWVLLRIFGIEVFSVSTACMPDPVLILIREYSKEIPA